MKDSVKKIIAREWLYFLLFLVVGLVVMPLLATFLDIGIFVHWTKFLRYVKYFYYVLFGEPGRIFVYSVYVDSMLAAWLFVLIPYFIFQLGRSVKYSFRILKIG